MNGSDNTTEYERALEIQLETTHCKNVRLEQEFSEVLKKYYDQKLATTVASVLWIITLLTLIILFAR